MRMFVPMDRPVTSLPSLWAHTNNFLVIFLTFFLVALALPSFSLSSLSPPSRSFSLSSHSCCLLHMLFSNHFLFCALVVIFSFVHVSQFCIHFILALFWLLLMVITIGSCFVKWVLPLLCIHFVLVSIYDCNSHNSIFAHIAFTSIHSCNNRLDFCLWLQQLTHVLWVFVGFNFWVASKFLIISVVKVEQCWMVKFFSFLWPELYYWLIWCKKHLLKHIQWTPHFSNLITL